MNCPYCLKQRGRPRVVRTSEGTHIWHSCPRCQKKVDRAMKPYVDKGLVLTYQ